MEVIYDKNNKRTVTNKQQISFVAIKRTSVGYRRYVVSVVIRLDVETLKNE